MRNTEGRVEKRKARVPRFLTTFAAVAAAMKVGKEGTRKEGGDSRTLSEWRETSQREWTCD